MVSGDYFRGLGASPALGRLIAAADEASAAHVAVISYPYWKRRFAADPAVVGRAVTINHEPFTIVGVTAPAFFGVQPGRFPDVWVPMLNDPGLVPWGYRPSDASDLLEARSYWWAQVMARLAPGIEEAQARAAADAAFQSFLPDALPEADRSKLPHIGFEPGAGGIDTLRSTYEAPLQLLMGMVAFVLLIACANVAVLLLARAMSRRREFALRLSLGAARPRLVRQLLTESLVMAAVGGLLGIVCAGWTSRALLLLVPPDRRPFLAYQIDAPTLVFAAVVSLLTVVVFGLVPALVATRLDLLPAIKDAAAGAVASEPPTQRAWSAGFVIVQIALSLVLLVGAALFVRTLANLQRQALGVDDERILVFGLDASQNGYDGARLSAVYQSVLHRLEALPGVEHATASRLRLFSGWVSNGAVTIPGIERKASMSLDENDVGPAFAAATGMHVLAGRDLTWGDIEGHRPVALMSESAARYFFGDTNVVGRRYAKGETFDASDAYEIVGVVSDAKYSQVRGPFPRTAYVPFTAMHSELHDLFFEIRTAADPIAIASSVRGAVQQIDATLALVQMDTMANQVSESLWQERLFARLTTAFSALALVLACIGLYGTISYGVGRRRAEIALRMALGAQRTQVQWLVLRRALGLAAVGVLIGLPLALWGGTLISSMLYGLTPRDPATLAAAAVSLVLVASLAGYLPARRASLVDPARALKQDG